jgi:hypothetical protein
MDNDIQVSPFTSFFNNTRAYFASDSPETSLPSVMVQQGRRKASSLGLTSIMLYVFLSFFVNA